jgi:hypothetical protein
MMLTLAPLPQNEDQATPIYSHCRRRLESERDKKHGGDWYKQCVQKLSLLCENIRSEGGKQLSGLIRVAISIARSAKHKNLLRIFVT